MTESTPTLSIPAGVSAEEFTSLLAKGKQSGSVTADDLMEILEDVELSAELIDQVRGRLEADGIELEDDAAAPDEPLEQGLTPPGPAPAVRAVRTARAPAADTDPDTLCA